MAFSKNLMKYIGILSYLSVVPTGLNSNTMMKELSIFFHWL